METIVDESIVAGSMLMVHCAVSIVAESMVSRSIVIESIVAVSIVCRDLC